MTATVPTASGGVRAPIAPVEAVGVVTAGFARGDHAGMQVYASRHGAVIADFAVGSAGRPGVMTVDTPVPWFSSTKPLVALLVARAVDAGAFGFDDPVATWLPEFAAEGKEEVTVRHLLTHTVPFDRDLRVRQVLGDFDRATTALRTVGLRPGGTVGRVAQYSWFVGWHALAVVLERISGERISTTVRRAIFEPLGMDDCWLGVPEDRRAAVAARVSDVFETSDGSSRAVSLVGKEGVLATTIPGMGGVGPMRELARVYEALVSESPEAMGVSAATARMITATARTGLKDPSYGGAIRWGLGFITDRRVLAGPRATGAVFGHDGHRCAMTFADAGSGLVLCAMANGLPDLVTNRERFRSLAEVIFDAAEVPRPRRRWQEDVNAPPAPPSTTRDQRGERGEP